MLNNAYQLNEDDSTQALIDRLTDADLDQLIAILQAKRYGGWLNWFFAEQDAIGTWFYSTDRERAKVQKDQSDGERLLLIFGAIWLSQFAQVTRLQYFDNALLETKDSRSRRVARGSVVATGLQALMTRQIGWPFDRPCPFQGWG